MKRMTAIRFPMLFVAALASSSVFADVLFQGCLVVTIFPNFLTVISMLFYILIPHILNSFTLEFC